MKKFLKNIVFFAGCFTICYLVFFYFTETGLKSSDYQENAEWNPIFDGEINADLVITGSSRAWMQINTKIIEDSLGLNAFNLGMNGFHFPMQVCRYQIYKKFNKKPKFMIQILDHFTLQRRNNLFFKSQFIPHLGDSSLASFTKQYEGFTWASYNIPYFKYFGSKEVVFAGLLEYFGLKKFSSPKYKGFDSKISDWTPGFDIEKKNKPEGKRVGIQYDVVELFENFIKDVKNDGVELILIYPPDYIEFQNYITNRDSVLDIYRSLSSKHNIRFIDYSNDTICKSKKYFYDPTHLNSFGADILTNKIIQNFNALYD